MADDPKLAEFRENNIKLTKQNEDLTKQVTELQVQLAAVDTKELTTAKATLATRDTELATEKAAHAATKKRADAFVIEQKVGDAFPNMTTARTHLTSLADKAQKLGWERRKFEAVRKPDAFSSLPAPKAVA